MRGLQAPPIFASLAAAALALAAHQAFAFDCASLPGALERTCEQIGAALDHGERDLYLPLHAHHGRGTYSPEKIRSFNEQNFGFGYGRSIVDERGDWRGIYAMVFQDSHYKPEPLAGYAYQAYWGRSASLEAGVGYTVFLSARSDIHRYTPFPGVLPLVSLRYRGLALMMVDIPRVPGRKGMGDVLFFFARASF